MSQVRRLAGRFGMSRRYRLESFGYADAPASRAETSLIDGT
jgi:hypothetical protein